jgi:microcystin-dependent protein
MARGFYQNTIALAQPDGTLKSLAGVNIFVYQPGTQTLATIYAGRTGAAQANNPLLTDSTGLVEFYADVGEYDIRTKDTNAVPRIADRTVAWESVSGADAGIPWDKINVSAADLLALIQMYAFRPGDLKLSAVSSVMDGWLLCDGTAISRTTYADLFNAINVAYGPGDGSNTFNLPDYRGRMPVGADNGAGRLTTNNARGNSGGEEAHLLLSAESGVNGSGSTTASGVHSHQIHAENVDSSTGSANWSGLIAYAQTPRQFDAFPNTGVDGSHSHPLSSRDATVPHNNMPPYQVGNWFIKY